MSVMATMREPTAQAARNEDYLYNARRFTIDLMISMWALKFCPDFLKT